MIYNNAITWTLFPEQNGIKAKPASSGTRVKQRWDDFRLWSQMSSLPFFTEEKKGAGEREEKKKENRQKQQAK